MERLPLVAIQSVTSIQSKRDFEETPVRARSERYIADLQAKLAITERQMDAWKLFAGSLRANQRRMQAFEGDTEQPFGALQDRLSALDTMRQAAAELFAILDSAQHRAASRLLPLCCLPAASLGAAVNGPRPNAASMSDFIAELKRNAAYYSAGPDREAGDLLWRAARALEQN
jgi:hypothetical protein